MEFKVTKKAMRPASIREECFCCQQAIGESHKPDCVLIRKTVKVRAVVEYEINVPNGWDANQIEFHRNEGTWCCNNMIDELKAFSDLHGCLCDVTEFKHLSDISGPVLKE